MEPGEAAAVEVDNSAADTNKRQRTRQRNPIDVDFIMNSLKDAFEYEINSYPELDPYGFLTQGRVEAYREAKRLDRDNEDL